MKKDKKQKKKKKHKASSSSSSSEDEWVERTSKFYPSLLRVARKRSFSTNIIKVKV